MHTSLNVFLGSSEISMPQALSLHPRSIKRGGGGEGVASQHMVHKKSARTQNTANFFGADQICVLGERGGGETGEQQQ
jgi:hypothetical protein